MDQARLHVSWGPEAGRLSVAEREAIVADLAETARRRHQQNDAAKAALGDLPYVAVPIEQMADIYRRMLRLVRLGQASVDEWSKMPEEMAALKHAIFAEADFGAVYAGQWLPRDVRDATRSSSAQPQSENAT